MKAAVKSATNSMDIKLVVTILDWSHRSCSKYRQMISWLSLLTGDSTRSYAELGCLIPVTKLLHLTQMICLTSR